MEHLDNFIKIALVIQYDGTRYSGFQWQANSSTIQAELERAIEKLNGEASRVVAASRTDAGVHAKEQVVSFRTKCALPMLTLNRALNYYLPGDIVVRAAYKVSEDFNARRDALSREYDYYILNRQVRSPFTRNFSYFVAKELNIEIMNEACRTIQGEHDFTSFITSLAGVTSTIRNVHEAKVKKRGDFVIFHMVANSFLPHQVRNTMGILIRVGLGKLAIEEFRHIMEARRLGLAGPMASPYGLYLTKINYPKPLGEWR